MSPPYASHNSQFSRRLAQLIPMLVALLAMTGCGAGVDPAVQKLREQLTLVSKPADSIGILEAKEKAKDGPADITLAAQVTSGEYSYWDESSAMFAVSEIIEDDGHGGEGHDPSTCPFCKRRAAKLKDRRAMVKVVDDKGEVVPMHAKKLLGIDENRILVLQGSAKLDKQGNLVVHASKVFAE